MSDEFMQKSRITKPADLTEIGLRTRASEIAAVFTERLPFPHELADIQEHFGVEIATTVLLMAIETIPAYRTFLRRVRSAQPDFSEATRTKARDFEVTFIASNLFQSGRAWGDHVETWVAWARSLGFTTDWIPTEPRQSVSENARTISRYLINHPHPNRIIVTYGQGAAELKTLMLHHYGERGGDEPRSRDQELDSVRLWLNVCGAYGGVTSTDVLTGSRWRELFTRARLRFAGRSAQVLDELKSKNGLLRRTPNFPEAMTVVNIIGLPLRSQIPTGLNLLYTELSKLGPTDAVLSFYEMIAHPGLIVPIPGMSHAIQDFKLEPIFKRVLAVFLESAVVKKPTSAAIIGASEALTLEVSFSRD